MKGVQQLKDTVAELLRKDEAANSVETCSGSWARVDAIIAALDPMPLADRLKTLTTATGEERSKLIESVRLEVAKLQKALDGKVINQLEANPFGVEVGIKKALGPALNVIPDTFLPGGLQSCDSYYASNANASSPFAVRK